MRLHSFIISWAKHHSHAEQIYRQIQSACDKVHVVFSDPSPESPFLPDIQSIRRPDNLMFGDKLAACLDAFSGDLFLLIHADCTCKDWHRVASLCLDDFCRFPHIGLWSPLVTNSLPALEFAEIAKLPNSSLSHVANTDCIVIAMRKEGVDTLRKCDLRSNVHGWWGHVPALVELIDSGKIAVMNYAIRVSHATGRGYSSEQAGVEGFYYLKKMPARHQAIWEEMKLYCEHRARSATVIQRLLNRCHRIAVRYCAGLVSLSVTLRHHAVRGFALWSSGR